MTDQKEQIQYHPGQAKLIEAIANITSHPDYAPDRKLELISDKAKVGAYHDSRSISPASPVAQLIVDLHQAGYYDLSARARRGEYTELEF